MPLEAPDNTLGDTIDEIASFMTYNANTLLLAGILVVAVAILVVVLVRTRKRPPSQ